MTKLLIIRVKEKGRKGDHCYEYKNQTEISNPAMVSLIFQDLIDLYDLPLEKVIANLKLRKQKEKETIFPFS